MTHFSKYGMEQVRVIIGVIHLIQSCYFRFVPPIFTAEDVTLDLQVLIINDSKSVYDFHEVQIWKLMERCTTIVSSYDYTELNRVIKNFNGPGMN